MPDDISNSASHFFTLFSCKSPSNLYLLLIVDVNTVRQKKKEKNLCPSSEISFLTVYTISLVHMRTDLGGRIRHVLSVFTAVWYTDTLASTHARACATCPICHITRGGFMTLQRRVRCKTANPRKDPTGISLLVVN